jgi:PPIC-type PPIASE domain/SurA-like N-terminal domain
MAKRNKTEERRPVAEETRKQAHYRRKDAEANRRLMIGLGAVAAILIILIGAGLIQELVLKPSQPVATVNRARISSQDYRKRVLFDWFQAGDQVQDPQGSSVQVLDQMIDEELIREQARQRGITVSPDEVTEFIEKQFGYLRNPPTPTPAAAISPTPLPSPTPGGSPTPTPLPTPTPVSLEAFQSAYKNYMERLGKAADFKEADFRALAELDLLRQKLYDAVVADVPTTEEQVRAQHILVRIIEPQPTATPLPEGQPTPTPDPSAQPTPVPRSDDQALARINEVKLKLDAGGDFATLAKEYSEDTGSKDQGGELGWFGKGQMVAEFEEAAFKLQPGQVSEPVKTQFGYHLIKVEERDPARTIDAYTLQQKQYEAFQKWLTDLRTAATIERNWSLDKVPPTPGVPVQ